MKTNKRRDARDWQTNVNKRKGKCTKLKLRTSGKYWASDCSVTFIKLGWLNPGVSARYPPPNSGSRETLRVVCFPLPLFVDTSPTRWSSNHLLSNIWSRLQIRGTNDWLGTHNVDKTTEYHKTKDSKPTESNQLSTSVAPRTGLWLLKALIRLDFPTPLGPTITEVCSLKVNWRVSSSCFDSTLQKIGS